MFGLFKTTRERVMDLESAVVTLGSQVKALREEWDNFHDLHVRRAARDRKRDRDEQAAQPVLGPGGSDAHSQPPDPRAARLLKRAELFERIKARGHNGVRT